MADDALHELTAGYALDALDAAEMRAYERHLAHCARCQQELAALSAEASALAFAAEPAQPPPALRERILEAARAERPNVVPFRRPAYGLRARTALVAVAAAASVAAVGLGIWDVVLQNRLDRSHGALRSTALVIDANRQGTLVVTGLSAPPRGKTYEAWVIAGGKAEPAGLFGGGAGTVVVHLRRPVPHGAIVGVTVEPAGGSQQPTATPFITSAQV